MENVFEVRMVSSLNETMFKTKVNQCKDKIIFKW